jgi:hypothetical protein
MALTGTGAICLPLENMRTLLAACDSFQDFVEAGDATEALASVSLFREESDSLTKPCAVVVWSESDSHSIEQVASGGNNLFTDSGCCDVFFLADVSDSYKDSLPESFVSFLNAVGAVLDEIKELAGLDEYLCVDHMEKIAGPSRDDKATGGVEMEIGYRFHWSGK